VRVVGLSVALVACAPPAIDRGSASLTDAREDDGHPSVGRYVFSTDGATQNGGCTATVIGRRTLLTAGHCAGYQMNEIELGDPPVRYAVERDFAHPDFDSGRAWEQDLALIVAVDPLPVPAVPIERRRAEIGEPVVLVGYGETALGALDNGTKRVADNDVEALEDLYFVVEGSGGGEGNGCRGDSGGPVLIVEGERASLLGVMSFVPGLGSGCGASTWITRLDLYAGWIDSASGGDAVFADHTPPMVQILTPMPGERVLGATAVQVAAMDEQGVTELVIAIDGVPYEVANGASYSERIELALGSRRISATAKDRGGNETTASVDVESIATGAPAPEEEGCTTSGGAPGPLSLLLLVLWAQRSKRTRR
jgi:uncharacterized protein (TIGR03382 family)